ARGSGRRGPPRGRGGRARATGPDRGGRRDARRGRAAPPRRRGHRAQPRHAPRASGPSGGSHPASRGRGPAAPGLRGRRAQPRARPPRGRASAVARPRKLDYPRGFDSMEDPFLGRARLVALYALLAVVLAFARPTPLGVSIGFSIAAAGEILRFW